MFALYYIGIYLIIACAVVIWFLPERWAHRSSLVVGGVFVALFINALVLIPVLWSEPGGVLLSSSINYFPAIGLKIQYQLSGLGLLFYCLITGIGSLIFFYAYHYMKPYLARNCFFSYLTLFSAAMLGIVTANNLLLLLIYWELTTVSSYLLIGYKHQLAAARKAAFQGLITTVVGGLAMIVAVCLIQSNLGTLNIHTLVTHPDLLQSSPYLPLITAMLIIGAITKSAQFPCHYWLPGAMQAPTPVSAYLHSATMVNAGIYLLAMLHPALHVVSWWYPVLTAIGLATMLTGGWMALRTNDIKAILAYTTIYALGSMFYLLAGSKALALESMVVFLAVHALYKAALFMLAGFLEKSYQTRDITKIHGLWRTSRLASIVLIINCASMAALPPFFGFFAKQLALESKLAAPDLTLLLEIITFAASGLVALQGIRLLYQLLPSRADCVPKPYTIMLLPSAVLTLLTLVFSAVPYAWDRLRLGHLAVQSITPAAHQVTWLSSQSYTGSTAWLSALITIIGVLFFIGRNQLMSIARRSRCLDRYLAPECWYLRLIDVIPRFAGAISKRLQDGNLQHYMSFIWGFFVILLGLGFWQHWPALQLAFADQHYPIIDIILALLAFVSVLAAAILRKPISILALLGIMGLIMAVIFLIHGAPDVAITQVLVETLIVIFFVLNVYRLPTLTISKELSWVGSLFAIVLAVLSGAAVTLLLLAITQHPLPSKIADYFMQQSLPAAGGRNVVNVILVDFRAFDTLGETVVIVAAAIGVLGLMLKHGRRQLP